MFKELNEVQTLIQQATGTADRGDAKVTQAAADHIEAMDESQLSGHIQNAADHAEQSGDTGTAQILEQVLSGKNLKQDMIALLRDNPQILEHFAPDFAKDILASFSKRKGSSRWDSASWT